MGSETNLHEGKNMPRRFRVTWTEEQIDVAAGISESTEYVQTFPEDMPKQSVQDFADKFGENHKTICPMLKKVVRVETLE